MIIHIRKEVTQVTVKIKETYKEYILLHVNYNSINKPKLKYAKNDLRLILEIQFKITTRKYFSTIKLAKK